MITIAPAGLSTTALTANSLSITATIIEKLYKSICINSTIQPQVTINYTIGTASLDNTVVFVPITAIITIVIPSENNSTITKLYTENFVVSFQGQTSLPTSATISSKGRLSNSSNIVCCKAKSCTIQDSLVVTIA